MPHNLSKRLYFFARQIHSLVHLILKFQKYNMGYYPFLLLLLLFFLSSMSTVFMKPKIPLAVKVLQVFPGKIIA